MLTRRFREIRNFSYIPDNICNNRTIERWIVSRKRGADINVKAVVTLDRIVAMEELESRIKWRRVSKWTDDDQQSKYRGTEPVKQPRKESRSDVQQEIEYYSIAEIEKKRVMLDPSHTQNIVIRIPHHRDRWYNGIGWFETLSIASVDNTTEICNLKARSVYERRILGWWRDDEWGSAK